MTIIRIGYIEVGKSDTGSGKQKVATVYEFNKNKIVYGTHLPFNILIDIPQKS